MEEPGDESADVYRLVFISDIPVRSPSPSHHGCFRFGNPPFLFCCLRFDVISSLLGADPIRVTGMVVDVDAERRSISIGTLFGDG